MFIVFGTRVFIKMIQMSKTSIRHELLHLLLNSKPCRSSTLVGCLSRDRSLLISHVRGFVETENDQSVNCQLQFSFFQRLM